MKQKYVKLFLSTFQLSACTFGGGFVIIPLLRKKFVEELGWIEEQEYDLTMHNAQNYSMKDQAGYVILQIMHRGLMGGWLLHDDHGFAPEVLCGIFTFCIYIEQENEFLVV